MGHKMGMPSMKLNNAGVKSKSCGSFRSVAGEGLEEREGHDPDIDRERSQQNIYTGYRSAEALMEYSRQHVDQLRDARGRKLRSDAVVMCATVLKPPAAYMATLPREEQIRLLDVAEKVLAQIVGPENIKATGTHFDEQGTHRHVFWEPMTQDGRLCAKEMHNLQFFAQINREIPAALREAGFEIDDCEMYDAAKEEYEKEKAKAGRSSFQFKADAEKAKKEIEQQIGELQGTLQDAKEELQTAEAELEAAHQKVRDSLQEVRKMAYVVQERREDLEALELELEVRQDAVTLYNDKIQELQAAEREVSGNVKQGRLDLQDVSQQFQGVSQQLDKTSLELMDVWTAVRSTKGELETLRAEKEELAEEVAVLKEAAKREYSAGAQRLSSDEWERRIADARQRLEQSKQLKELQAKVNLYERFISTFPEILQKFREWYAELQQRQKQKKRHQKEHLPGE